MAAPITPPNRRQLHAYAFDPMTTRLSGRRLTLDIRFEKLDPGPAGEMVIVADWDGTRQCWYEPVELDHPMILAQGGLRPNEGDPRFHQQVVYGVAMSVLERFERFLGRRFRWRGGRQLVLVPHAFEGRNAFFDPQKRAVLFGYFTADPEPGPNLPGQVMFTCLSVDIIVHEVAHAILHRLRPRYSTATNRDVFAWHEAFADLIALFHHFTFPEVVSEAVASAGSDLSQAAGLFALADEFGRSTGRGEALRHAISKLHSAEAAQANTHAEQTVPFDQIVEPHERGAVFVTAVFDAYLQTYRRQIADLLRIATGGTGILPAGNLHPDLVARVTAEAVKNADRFLGMVVRAIDYLPTVDVTFGDVVRAIVTSDRLLYPDDELHLRSALVEALRRRGIFPHGTRSLADESLIWPEPDTPLSLRDTGTGPPIDLSRLIHSATMDLDPGGPGGEVDSEDPDDTVDTGALAFPILQWAELHHEQLGFVAGIGAKGAGIAVLGYHVVYRKAGDGQPQPEVVIQLTQRRRDLEDEKVKEGDRVALIAGTTVIARVDGTVRYIVSKPLPRRTANVVGAGPSASDGGAGEPDAPVTVADREATDRLASIASWVGAVDADDPLSPWDHRPGLSRLTFARLHGEVG